MKKSSDQTPPSIVILLGRFFFKRKKILLVVWGAGFVTFCVVAFLSTKQYTTSSIFHVKGKGSLEMPIPDGLKALSGNFKSKGDASIMETVLGSRKLSLAMVNAFNLKEVYQTEWEHLAIKAFNSNYGYEDHDDNIFSIRFTYPHQDSVKIIADSILKFANNEVINIETSKAKNEYLFNQMIVDSVMWKIDSLGNEIVNVLNSEGIIDFESQVKHSLEVYSRLSEKLVELKAQLAAAKVENKMSNTEMEALKESIFYLESKKESLTRRAKNKIDRVFSFSMNYDSISSVAVLLKKIEFKIEKNKQMLKALIPALEQSRLNMIQTIPVVSIIDPTYVPPYKSGPKRLFIIVLGTLVVGIFATLFLLIREVLVNPQFRTKEIDSFLRILKAIKG